MEREQPSRRESNAGTGVLDPDPETVTTGPPAAKREATQSRAATIATGVHDLVAVALSIPDVRLARLRALKELISAGTYQVTTEQVAEVVLEQMQVSWKAGGHRRSFGA
jgi:anti-sigma28 factor (negative regulator of flagellin synthesis)